VTRAEGGGDGGAMSFEATLIEKILTLMRQRFGGTDRASLERLFGAYDTNGDSEIDSDELARLLADAGVGSARTRKAWVRAAMRQLDSDGSRTISVSELSSIID
jgi:Ca2+-binding EF-hand superfamily protein